MVTRIATVNIAAAVTVMVPNSLGPAELLLRYGSDAQKRHYLPRLADGRELPCFALTSPYAGSDAASIPDVGVLVEREIDGRLQRGFVVNFDKRYITLAPVATVVGLAFQAVDPSRPEGQRELGITCALIPVPTPGMEVGRRHRPMNSAFMNGPVRGSDVFVPMDWIIGGEAQVGQGWRMLMECLAAGRAISLPALGAALQQSSLFVANGYGRIREQFGLPIGRFHAVAALIARRWRSSCMPATPHGATPRPRSMPASSPAWPARSSRCSSPKPAGAPSTPAWTSLAARASSAGRRTCSAWPTGMRRSRSPSKARTC